MTPSDRRLEPTWQDGPGPDSLCGCGSSRVSRYDGGCADCQEEEVSAESGCNEDCDHSWPACADRPAEYRLPLLDALDDRKRSTLTVTIDLDPVPGWGNTARDHQKLVQRLLDNAVGHYNPRVEVALPTAVTLRDPSLSDVIDNGRTEVGQ